MAQKLYQVHVYNGTDVDTQSSVRDIVLRTDGLGADIVRFARQQNEDFSFHKDPLLDAVGSFFIECSDALFSFIWAHQDCLSIKNPNSEIIYQTERSEAMHHHFEAIADKARLRHQRQNKQRQNTLKS